MDGWTLQIVRLVRTTSMAAILLAFGITINASITVVIISLILSVWLAAVLGSITVMVHAGYELNTADYDTPCPARYRATREGGGAAPKAGNASGSPDLLGEDASVLVQGDLLARSEDWTM